MYTALQLVSRLEGDPLNVALLVPAPQRVLPGVLLDALTEHSSSGRLADYRRQFERVSRSLGDDPSVFAIELETLAMRAFADLNASARLQLIRDRFIARQRECSLRRHLDSVGQGTPIRDIVDQCCVWESHAEDRDSWGACPSPERPRPVYRVDDIQPESKPEVSSEDQDMLDLLMRQLLPTPAVSPTRATPIPSDRELLIQRLMGPELPVRPVLQECSNLRDIETLIQSLLPVGSVVEENVRPTADRYESTVVCFSCGESGHATSRCPVLDGKRIGWMMNLFYDHLQGGLTVFERETSADPGRGVGHPDQ